MCLCLNKKVPEVPFSNFVLFPLFKMQNSSVIPETTQENEKSPICGCINYISIMYLT